MLSPSLASTLPSGSLQTLEPCLLGNLNCQTIYFSVTVAIIFFCFPMTHIVAWLLVFTPQMGLKRVTL